MSRKKRKGQRELDCSEIHDEDLFGYLDGWEEASGASDMPDGAWEAVMKEGVAAFNESNKTDYDEHEGWLAWQTHDAK